MAFRCLVRDLAQHFFYQFDISCRIFCTTYPSTERQDVLSCSGILTRSFNCTSSAMTSAQQVSLQNESSIQHELRGKLAKGSSRMPNFSGGPTRRLVTRSLENSQPPRQAHGRAIYSMHPRVVWQEAGGGRTWPALQVKLQYSSLATIAFQGLSARCSMLWLLFGNLILHSLRQTEFRRSLIPKNSSLSTLIGSVESLPLASGHTGGLWKRATPGDGQ